MKSGVMERLQWYQQLRKIYDEVNVSNQALKSKILSSLAESLPNLNLKTQKDYMSLTSNQGFSFEEIYSHIESMPRTIR